MRSDTETYAVLREGATRDETRSWREIEAMCRSGELSPESLIFMPAEDRWVKARDTELGPIFAEMRIRREKPPTLPVDHDGQRSRYRDTVERSRQEGGNIDLEIQAAGIAIDLGDVDAAGKHFQRALDIRPYHPRIVREAKRMLPREVWGSLRFLDRPEPFWRNIGELCTYPFTRGPIYILVPTLVLSAVAMIPYVRALALPVWFLWGLHIITSAASGEKKPPLWHGVLSDPVGTGLKPLLAGMVVAAETYLPFLAVAQIAVLAGASWHSSAFVFIEKSPVMIVLMSFLSFFYLPAALSMLAAPPATIWAAADPRKVLALIFKLEGEYLSTAGFIFGLAGLCGVVAASLGRIPYLGVVFTTAAGIVSLLAAGFALGKMRSRFHTDPESSGPSPSRLEDLADIED